ncbi:hypothetical protein D6783_01575 [Candidatus Woesearchaeota archaeon]|nr:MAG: hypothetical protein D6783_01575 [Candidatus Woesearchaeota archaeon]
MEAPSSAGGSVEAVPAEKARQGEGGVHKEGADRDADSVPMPGAGAGDSGDSLDDVPPVSQGKGVVAEPQTLKKEDVSGPRRGGEGESGVDAGVAAMSDENVGDGWEVADPAFQSIHGDVSQEDEPGSPSAPSQVQAHVPAHAMPESGEGGAVHHDRVEGGGEGEKKELLGSDGSVADGIGSAGAPGHVEAEEASPTEGVGSDGEDLSSRAGDGDALLSPERLDEMEAWLSGTSEGGDQDQEDVAEKERSGPAVPERNEAGAGGEGLGGAGGASAGLAPVGAGGVDAESSSSLVLPDFDDTEIEEAERLELASKMAKPLPDDGFNEALALEEADEGGLEEDDSSGGLAKAPVLGGADTGSDGAGSFVAPGSPVLERDGLAAQQEGVARSDAVDDALHAAARPLVEEDGAAQEGFALPTNSDFSGVEAGAGRESLNEGAAQLPSDEELSRLAAMLKEVSDKSHDDLEGSVEPSAKPPILPDEEKVEEHPVGVVKPLIKSLPSFEPRQAMPEQFEIKPLLEPLPPPPEKEVPNEVFVSGEDFAWLVTDLEKVRDDIVLVYEDIDKMVTLEEEKKGIYTTWCDEVNEVQEDLMALDVKLAAEVKQ